MQVLPYLGISIEFTPEMIQTLIDTDLIILKDNGDYDLAPKLVEAMQYAASGLLNTISAETTEKLIHKPIETVGA